MGVLVQKYTYVVRALGKPITFLLSPGERNESIFLEQLMEQGTVKRSLARSSAYTSFPVGWRQRLYRSSHP